MTKRLPQELAALLLDGAARMGLALPEDRLPLFGVYLFLLQSWGSKINLTTRISDKEVVVHHFLDSLAGTRFLPHDRRARVVDLGAGAGLPSFPLKFALPLLNVVQVESSRKKISFCQEVIRSTGLAGVEAVWGRAEEVGRRPEYRSAFDWAVSRALGRSADIVRLVLPLLRPGGTALLYKGKPERTELLELAALCSDIDAVWRLESLGVPHLEAERSMIVVTLANL